MNNYLYKRKFTSKFISILLYSSFVGLILSDIQYFKIYYYGIHEMFYIPANISMLILPVLIVLWIYYYIKSIKEKEEAELKTKFINIINTFICIFIILYFIFYFNTCTVVGLFEIKEKIEKDTGHYFVVEHDTSVLVRCSQSVFNLVKENEKYVICMKINNFSKEKGKLIEIK